MKTRKILLLSTLCCALQACVSNLTCDRAVKFQGYKAEVSGLEVTGLGKGTYKIGKASFEPTKIHEAKSLIAAIDTLQFADCQTMLLLHKEENIMKIAENRRNTMATLTSVLTKFDAAEDQQQHDEALKQAKEEKEKLIPKI